MSWMRVYPDESGSDMRLALQVGFWVAVMAVLAFLPAIGCDFVNMDDNREFSVQRGAQVSAREEAGLGLDDPLGLGSISPWPGS